MGRRVKRRKGLRVDEGIKDGVVDVGVVDMALRGVVIASVILCAVLDGLSR